MKKFSLLSICILIFLFFSCEKEEVVYSCDPEIDEWVKSNLSEIETFEWKELAQIGERYQQAAFAVFSSEQRLSLWAKKLEHTLLLNWTYEEKSHLALLLKEIQNNPDWFIPYYFESNEIEYDKFMIFFYKWIEFSKEKLGWDSSIIQSIIGTLKAPLTTTGIIESNTDITHIKTRSESKCNCNTKLGNSYNECNSNYKHCSTKSSCVESSWSCSPLYVGKCNGLCSDN